MHVLCICQQMMILISNSWIYIGESKDANKKWDRSEDELNFSLFYVVIRLKYLKPQMMDALALMHGILNILLNFVSSM